MRLLGILRLLSLGLASSSILGLGASLLIGRDRPLASRLGALAGYLVLTLLGLASLGFSAGLGMLFQGLPALP